MGLASSAWPKAHYNARNTGCTHVKTYTDGTLLWKEQICAAGFTYSSPVVRGDGTIIIGGNDGKTYCVSPSDGSILWSTNSPLGGGIRCTPLIRHDDFIYIYSLDPAILLMNPAGSILFAYSPTRGPGGGGIAIDEDSNLYWVDSWDQMESCTPDLILRYYDPGGYWQSAMSTPALGDDGFLYVLEYATPAIRKLKRLDGSSVWGHTTDGSLTNSVSIDEKGNIYAGTDTRIEALTPDGVQIWQNIIAPVFSPQSPPVILPGGVLVVQIVTGAWPNYVVSLYGLDISDGTTIWSTTITTTGTQVFSSLAGDALGNIYGINRSGIVYCLDSAGVIKWSYDTGSGATNWNNPAICNNGTVIIADKDGYIHAFKSTIPGVPSGGRSKLGIGGASVLGGIAVERGAGVGTPSGTRCGR